MSYSKTIFLIGITAVLLISFFLLKKKRSSVDQEVIDAILILKNSGDDYSRDCEVFDKLMALSSKSSDASLMIAQMYARSLCKPFDLDKAIKWYKKGNFTEAKIGSALFRASRLEMPPGGNTGLSKNQLLLLLNKAKEFGYKPTHQEMSRLDQEYLEVFTKLP